MKKILFTILSCFLFVGICNAEITTYDRNVLENYGVNKKWVIDEYNKFEVLNTLCVDAKQKIYDFSDILTEEEEKELKSKRIKRLTKNFISICLTYLVFSFLLLGFLLHHLKKPYNYHRNSINHFPLYLHKHLQ